MEKNRKFRRYILTELRRKGPLPSRYFEDKSVEDWRSTGWSAGRNVNMMLTILWAQGKIMIAGRDGIQKLWDLTEQYLSEWTPREQLSESDVFHRVAQKSLRALGVAHARHIKQHYIRGYIRNIEEVLTELEAEGHIVRVEIREDGKARRGPWYVHAEDEPLVDRLAAGDWEPQTTLLSPFDNLICDRKRLEQVFNFHFRLEVYVPKSKRKYGCYVMPILHGDRLIGRIDPVMDRKQRRLTINAVYLEPDAPKSKETGQALANAIKELGAFLGAEEILYSERVPSGWKSLLS